MTTSQPCGRPPANGGPIEPEEPRPGEPVHALVVTTVHHPLDARILHRQIRCMVRAGWTVTYVAPWTGEEPIPDGIEVVRVPRSVGRRRLASARAARRVLRELSCTHQVTLIHDLDLVPVALSVRTARPLVWDVHEDTAAALTDRSWVPRAARPLVRALVHRLERHMERRHSLLLAEASYQARFSRQHPVVPNLPWARSEPSALAEPARAVYVGRLSASRGLGEMIELGRRLRGQVQVALVGDVDAADRSVLEAAVAAGDVRWHGRLPNERALEIVEGALVGLSLLHDHPNYRGSMPTKLIEYLSAGVPVLTTPLPLAVELVEDTGAGWVVGFGDLDAAEATVLELLQRTSQRHERAEAGYRAALDRYSWDAVCPDFLAALRDVVEVPA